MFADGRTYQGEWQNDEVFIASISPSRAFPPMSHHVLPV